MKRKNKVSPLATDHTLNITYLNKDTNIQGDIISDDNLRIGGIINGKCISKGKLIISEKAVINGDIKGSSIDIYGKVKGDVQTDSLLYLSSGSAVEGDVNCQKLKIDEGAYFQGNINSDKNFSKRTKKYKSFSEEIHFSDIIKRANKETQKVKEVNTKNNGYESSSEGDTDELQNGRLW